MVDRFAGVWVVTFLILGLFVAVAVISPSMLPDIDDGGNGGTVGDRIDYKIPALSTTVGEMEEGKAAKMRVVAQPERTFLDDGGSWAWAFSLIGTGLDINSATLRFGDGSYTEWMSVPGSGTITGYGPKFMQGPSSATAPVEAELELSIFAPGSFTLRIWIMEQSAMASNALPTPTSPLARSADLVAPLKVNEHDDPWVKVTQKLSGPSGVQDRNRMIGVKLTDTVDRGDTKWDGTIVDYIAIEREGINASDIMGRVTSPSRSTIVWEQDGGRLVGSLKSTSLFSGRIDQTRWTIDMELRFAVGGTYKITTWAIDGESKEIVSSISSMDIEVKPEVVEPKPVPIDPNSTNSSASSLLPLRSIYSTVAPPSDAVAAAVRE